MLNNYSYLIIILPGMLAGMTIRKNQIDIKTNEDLKRELVFGFLFFIFAGVTLISSRIISLFNLGIDNHYFQVLYVYLSMYSFILANFKIRNVIVKCLLSWFDRLVALLIEFSDNYDS